MNQPARFSEIEYCLQAYFKTNMLEVMKSVRDGLSRRQTDERAAYASTFAGSLVEERGGAGVVNTHLRMTGEWNSKTSEDYVSMCCERIASSKEFTHDLALIAAEWRTAVVGEIGRERYDALSAQLGGDLANAYIDYRVQQMMVDKMVADQMPRSTFEYIMRRCAEGSLLNIANDMAQSQLDMEVSSRAEKAYRPSTAEKVGGRAASFAADIITTGGASSWGSLAKLAGVEVVMAGLEQKMENAASRNKPMTVEECISQGVFNSKKNVFTDFRNAAGNINPCQSSFIKTLSNKMTKKIPTQPIPKWGETPWMTSQEPDPRYKNLPRVVAPGQEEEWLEQQRQMKTPPQPSPQGEGERKLPSSAEASVENDNATTLLTEASVDGNNTTPSLDQKLAMTALGTRAGEGFWSSLLSMTGLNGFSDVTHNLGYVVSMLPDLLFGMFTGKTDLKIKDNLMPIASILLGMFIKNPILKMILIGFGGANLLNKAGHEALGKAQASDSRVTSTLPPSRGELEGGFRYRRYADEPLNPRIQSPMLQGCSLIAVIDRVPCSVALPDDVIAAHKAGALPLNTLANAVLEQYIQQQQMSTIAQQAYDSTQQQMQDRERVVVMK